jgi:putative PIN family toxin of toxin-antitoxin system
MKFFIDTNIIISSALFPNGKTACVFSYILEAHEVIISDYVLKECELVFEMKFPDKIQALRTFLKKIEYKLFITPKKIDEKKYPKIRDRKDLPILVAAILSNSDILLTGDKDFSTIAIKKPLIFTPNEYFEFINQ